MDARSTSKIHPSSNPTSQMLDITTIDPRINELYDNPIYKEGPISEASTMKNTRQCCGQIPKFICLPFAVCQKGPIKIIPQGYIGLRLQYGEIKEKLAPGLHEYNTCTEIVKLVDLRTQSINTEYQILMTKDMVTIRINCFGFYKITVPELAFSFLSEIQVTIRCFIMGAMKEIVAERSLADLLYNRAEVEKSLELYVKPRCRKFGVDILNIDMEEIGLPGNIRNEMAVVAQSGAEAIAKITKAKGNLDSALLLKQAADEFSKNSISMQLQYMNVMKEIAAEKPTTLVLPSMLSRKRN